MHIEDKVAIMAGTEIQFGLDSLYNCIKYEW